MRLLTLLFDPRGVIDRRAFWSGLIQLTVVSVAVFAGLTWLGIEVAVAALPVLGEMSAVSDIVSCVHDARAPDVALIATLLVTAARLHVTVCLMLKRARDAGKSADIVIALGLAGLVAHGMMGRWAYDLWGSEIGTIIPLFLDTVFNTLLWTIFLIAVGARPSRLRTA
jgi:uncharacterized membrane protein YhaH (DUF805 family)